MRSELVQYVASNTAMIGNDGGRKDVKEVFVGFINALIQYF